MARQLKSQYERTTQLGLPVIREKGGMRWWPPELAPETVWEEVKPTPKPGEFYRLQSSGSGVLILSSSGFMKRWRAAGRSERPNDVAEGVFVLRCGKPYHSSGVSQGEIAIYPLTSWRRWQKTKGTLPMPEVGAVRWFGLAKQRYVVLDSVRDLSPLSGAVWCEAPDGWHGYISPEDWWGNGTAIEPEKKAVSEIVEHWQKMTVEGPKWMHERICPDWEPEQGFEFRRCSRNGESTPLCEAVGVYDGWVWYVRMDHLSPNRGWEIGKFRQMMRDGTLVEVCDTKGDHDECAECSCVGYDE